jgi:hypothetical protein
MNDWYLDPPEDDEPPSCPTCSDGYGEYLTGNKLVMMLSCEDCGHRWMVHLSQDQSPEDYDFVEYEHTDYPKKCPHGEDWHECNACMVQSDFAYDAAREKH